MLWSWSGKFPALLLALWAWHLGVWEGETLELHHVFTIFDSIRLALHFPFSLWWNFFVLIAVVACLTMDLWHTVLHLRAPYNMQLWVIYLVKCSDFVCTTVIRFENRYRNDKSCFPEEHMMQERCVGFCVFSTSLRTCTHAYIPILRRKLCTNFQRLSNDHRQAGGLVLTVLRCLDSNNNLHFCPQLYPCFPVLHTHNASIHGLKRKLEPAASIADRHCCSKILIRNACTHLFIVEHAGLCSTGVHVRLCAASIPTTIPTFIPTVYEFGIIIHIFLYYLYADRFHSRTDRFRETRPCADSLNRWSALPLQSPDTECMHELVHELKHKRTCSWT